MESNIVSPTADRRPPTARSAGVGFFALLLGAAAIVPLPSASAAIIPKDSALFPKKFEMVTPTNEVNPTGTTTEWTLGTGGGASTASLSGGTLLIDTSAAAGRSRYWDSATWVALSDPAIGWTFEVSVRVDTAIDGGLGGGANRAFQLWAGDGASGIGGESLLVTVGTDRTYSGMDGSPTLIDSNDNSNDFHVFRIAKDANANVFQVWRDGIQIGTNLSPSYNDDDLYFGDGGGGNSGSGAFEYVRWDATGGYSPVIPEPASLTLIAAGAGLVLKRRYGR